MYWRNWPKKPVCSLRLSSLSFCSGLGLVVAGTLPHHILLGSLLLGSLLQENTALAAATDSSALPDSMQLITETQAKAFVGLAQRCRADIFLGKTGQLFGVVAENRYLLLNLPQPTNFLFLDRQKTAGKVTLLLRHQKNVDQTYYVTLQQQSGYSSTCSQSAQCKISEALLKLEQEKTEGRDIQKTLIQQMPVTVYDYCAGRTADRLFYSMPWYEKLFLNGFLRH